MSHMGTTLDGIDGVHKTHLHQEKVSSSKEEYLNLPWKPKPSFLEVKTPWFLGSKTLKTSWVLGSKR